MHGEHITATVRSLILESFCASSLAGVLESPKKLEPAFRSFRDSECEPPAELARTVYLRLPGES